MINWLNMAYLLQKEKKHMIILNYFFNEQQMKENQQKKTTMKYFIEFTTESYKLRLIANCTVYGEIKKEKKMKKKKSKKIHA